VAWRTLVTERDRFGTRRFRNSGGPVYGVARTVAQIRDRGVPGYEVEVIGTDADVDRRLSSVAEIEIPFYAGMRIGVPGVPALVEALADGRYDLLHLVSPGPAGIAGC